MKAGDVVQLTESYTVRGSRPRRMVTLQAGSQFRFRQILAAAPKFAQVVDDMGTVWPVPVALLEKVEQPTEAA